MTGELCEECTPKQEQPKKNKVWVSNLHSDKVPSELGKCQVFFGGFNALSENSGLKSASKREACLEESFN